MYMYMYICALLLARLVSSRLVLCDSGRMFRVSLLHCLVCLALSLSLCVCCLSVVLSVVSWLVSHLSCSRVLVFVGCCGCLYCLGFLACVSCLCVLTGEEGVFASNASPCVRSQRTRVCQHHAHMFYACGLGAVHTGAFSACHGTHYTAHTHTQHDHPSHSKSHSHNDTHQQPHTQQPTQPAPSFDSTRKNSPGPDTVRIDRKLFLDSMAVLSW